MKTTLITLILSIFTLIFQLYSPLHAETSSKVTISREPAWLDWQMQLIETIDAEDLNEYEYARMLETLYELDLDRHLNNYVNPDSTFPGHRELFAKVSSSFERCLNRREGFRHQTDKRIEANKAYIGSPLHDYHRFEGAYMDKENELFRVGLVAENDPGECWNTDGHPDHFGFFALYRREEGLFREATAGHYRLNLGCGLLCAQSFALSKNLLCRTLMEKAPTLSPHASARESDYMQGGAITLRPRRWLETTVFFSLRGIDGTLDNGILTSWDETGYHRTRAEEDRRKAARLMQVGTRICWKSEWAEVSANLIQNSFNHPYRTTERYYNRNRFRGERLLSTSLDYNLRWMGIHFKGETALSQNGGWATLNAAQGDIGFWKATALYRHYSNHYQQLQGHSVSESSALQGEQGATLLLEGPLSAHWDLSAWADWFHFSLPQYRIIKPCDGYEAALRLNYHRQRRHLGWKNTLAYRWKAKQRTQSGKQILEPYYHQSIDATLQCGLSTGWSFRTQAYLRMFFIGDKPTNSMGEAISQSITWHRPLGKLRCVAQGTWFKTDNYDSRLYLAERNTTHNYSIPMLQGEGWRASLFLDYQLKSYLTIEAKYARTTYRHQSTIGSGLQLIRDNHQDNLWITGRLDIVRMMYSLR